MIVYCALNMSYDFNNVFESKCRFKKKKIFFLILCCAKSFSVNFAMQKINENVCIKLMSVLFFKYTRQTYIHIFRRKNLKINEKRK